MKKFIFISAVCCLICSCNLNRYKLEPLQGDGNVITQRIEPGDFENIIFDIPMEIEYTPSEGTPFVEITCDSNILAAINPRVNKDKELIISLRMPKHPVSFRKVPTCIPTVLKVKASSHRLFNYHSNGLDHDECCCYRDDADTTTYDIKLNSFTLGSSHGTYFLLCKEDASGIVGLYTRFTPFVKNESVEPDSLSSQAFEEILQDMIAHGFYDAMLENYMPCSYPWELHHYRCETQDGQNHVETWNAYGGSIIEYDDDVQGCTTIYDIDEETGVQGCTKIYDIDEATDEALDAGMEALDAGMEALDAGKGVLSQGKKAINNTKK